MWHVALCMPGALLCGGTLKNLQKKSNRKKNFKKIFIARYASRVCKACWCRLECL